MDVVLALPDPRGLAPVATPPRRAHAHRRLQGDVRASPGGVRALRAPGVPERRREPLGRRPGAERLLAERPRPVEAARRRAARRARLRPEPRARALARRAARDLRRGQVDRGLRRPVLGPGRQRARGPALRPDAAPVRARRRRTGRQPRGGPPRRRRRHPEPPAPRRDDRAARGPHRARRLRPDRAGLARAHRQARPPRRSLPARCPLHPAAAGGPRRLVLQRRAARPAGGPHRGRRVHRDREPERPAPAPRDQPPGAASARVRRAPARAAHGALPRVRHALDRHRPIALHPDVARPALPPARGRRRQGVRAARGGGLAALLGGHRAMVRRGPRRQDAADPRGSQARPAPRPARPGSALHQGAPARARGHGGGGRGRSHGPGRHVRHRGGPALHRAAPAGRAAGPRGTATSAHDVGPRRSPARRVAAPTPRAPACARRRPSPAAVEPHGRERRARELQRGRGAGSEEPGGAGCSRACPRTGRVSRVGRGRRPDSGSTPRCSNASATTRRGVASSRPSRRSGRTGASTTTSPRPRSRKA